MYIKDNYNSLPALMRRRVPTPSQAKANSLDAPPIWAWHHQPGRRVGALRSALASARERKGKRNFSSAFVSSRDRTADVFFAGSALRFTKGEGGMRETLKTLAIWRM